MSNYVFHAVFGDRDAEESAGIYTTFEAAWDAAMKAGPDTAFVSRFALDDEGAGEPLRWREWSNAEQRTVSVTPETARARLQSGYAATRKAG